MPRSGKGARNRHTAAMHAQTRTLNAELREAVAQYGADSAPKRVSARVARITGHRIASGAVFSAMGIRPVEGSASRGQWLTARAMSETAATDRRTADQRRAEAREAAVKRAAGPTVAAMQRAIRRTWREIDAIKREIAWGAAYDEMIFAEMIMEIEAAFHATGNDKTLSEGLKDLQLRRAASREWEDEMITLANDGALTVWRVRDMIAIRRKNDVRNGRTAATVADFPLWEAREPETVTIDKAAKIIVHAAPVAEAPAIDPKYFTRGTD